MDTVELSPISTWLDTCIPGADIPRDLHLEPFNIASSSGRHDLLLSFCNGFNGIISQYKCKDLVMKAATRSDHQEPSAQSVAEADLEGSGRPDLVLFPNTQNIVDAMEVYQHPAMGVQQVAWTHLDGTSRTQDEYNLTRMIWANAELVVYTMQDPDWNPFSSNHRWGSNDSPIVLDHESDKEWIIEYAEEICSRQRRCFAFMILVSGRQARLIQVNRTATIVSEPFDYVEDPEPCATFVFRYINATRERRGFDPTATPATKDEADIFRGLPARYLNDPFLHGTLQKANAPGWPIVKLSITGRWSSDDQAVRRDSTVSTRIFLVGRPLVRSHFMTERGTTGFAAYDVSRDAIVFIKDYWRADLPDRLSEYDAYLTLSDVEHSPCNFIPTLLGGGDVCMDGPDSVQVTMSGKMASLSPSDRTHVRLVMKEVCRPLESFSDWRELVSVVRDALRAHQSAWEDHGLLHCDLSVGNILIYEKPVVPQPEIIGLLADWDLAKPKRLVLHPNASQPSRSGTWQFLSGALTRYQSKPHVLSDDLESVMHILNWLALKHLLNDDTDSPEALAGHIISIYYPPTPRSRGTFFKWHNVRKGYEFVHHEYSSTHPFISLLNELSAICKTHYERLPVESLIEAAGRGSLESVCTNGIAAADGSPSLAPPLGTHRAILAAFDKALQHEDWPELEKLEDQFDQIYADLFA